MRPVWIFLALSVVPAVMAGEPRPELKLLETLKEGRPGANSTIAFSPDGKTLAAGDYVIQADGSSVSSVKLWDVDKRKVIATLRGDTGLGDNHAFAVAFSSDGKTLAVSGSDLTLWDVATAKKKASFKGHTSPAFSPDGKTLAALGGMEGVTLWDVATGKEKGSLKGHLGALFCVAFSPDGKFIATGSGRSASNGQPSDGEVKLWDAATRRERASLKGRVKLKVSPKSLSYLRSEGVPKRVLTRLATLNGKEFPTEEDVEKELPKLLDKILDKDQREKYLDLVRLEVKTFHEGALVWVWSVAFSPDSKSLASADVYGNVLLWDVQSGKRSATLQAFNQRGKQSDINGAFSVAFSPDGNTLAAGTVRGIKLWDVKSGMNLVDVNRPLATVWSVAFSSDGKTLASAGSKRVIGPLDSIHGDEALRLWELNPSKKADK